MTIIITLKVFIYKSRGARGFVKRQVTVTYTKKFSRILGSGRVLEMLIEEANLDMNYGQASTALTTAIEYKRYDMMAILIDKGIHVIHFQNLIQLKLYSR